MKPHLPLLCLALLLPLSPFFAAPAAKENAAAAEAVRAVMQAEPVLREVRLREVIAAAAGREVLDFQPDTNPADAAARDHITAAAEKLRLFLNAAESPVRGLRRINEASRHVEDKLVTLLNTGGFTCAYPKTRAGETQRSGYPDLRLVHRESGRVYYLDPKLYEASSESSTLRTFYYEPKELSGKINDHACHLVLGIAHDGNDGAWKFTAWRLADLYDFRVRLKAEFHASNRDLYRDEFTVSRSKE
jgi:hypothetical protein